MKFWSQKDYDKEHKASPVKNKQYHEKLKYVKRTPTPKKRVVPGIPERKEAERQGA